MAGVSAASFVERMLLELLLHHRTLPSLDAEPTPSEQPGVIPISRGRQRVVAAAAYSYVPSSSDSP